MPRPPARPLRRRIQGRPFGDCLLLSALLHRPHKAAGYAVPTATAPLHGLQALLALCSKAERSKQSPNGGPCLRPKSTGVFYNCELSPCTLAFQAQSDPTATPPTPTAEEGPSSWSTSAPWPPTRGRRTPSSRSCGTTCCGRCPRRSCAAPSSAASSSPSSGRTGKASTHREGQPVNRGF